MPTKKIFCLLVIYTLGIAGCRKSLLNEKPSSEIFVPTTLDEFQTLLDNDIVINYSPALGENSADDYYVNDTFWVSKPNKHERLAYLWADKIFEGTSSIADWNTPYKQVFYANVILESIEKIAVTPGNQQQWNEMKGAAHFVRGHAFYNLAQIFCRAYDAVYLDEENLGLPLRLVPEVTENVSRSTLRQTYDRIITDLEAATSYLPTVAEVKYPTRASKPAAYALLSRVYLSMSRYEEAGLYADSCLQLYSALMNYNDPTAVNPNNIVYPFDKKNAEVLYYSILDPAADAVKSVAYRDVYVDTNLYKMYSTNDLRRTVFYFPTAKPYYKGGYSANIFKFSGLATDEVYITRAECHAHAGRISDAVNDLNKLLENRYKTGTFIPYSTTLSKEDALSLILRERRKELPSRGRWTDIRRLNKQGANITLKRVVANTTYTLPPNDLRYALPIPSDVLAFGIIVDNQRK